jgi:hypothetical protein
MVLLGLLAAAGVLAEAYTWTDADGVVHYSDRPEPGAKVIDLDRSSATRPRPSTRPRASQEQITEDEETTEAAGYTEIGIASPAADETLWNIGGNLNVTVALTPALRPGHQVRVYLDGAPQMATGTNVQLQDVYRGAHNLQAEVIDQTGKMLIRSRPSRFYVQQNSTR